MPHNRALIDVDALTDLFPFGIARATELVGLGLNTRLIGTNCRPGGPWQRIAPGIVLLGNGPPSRSQLIAGALANAGPGAVVTGWDALHQHGMSTPAGPTEVHLLVPHKRQVRTARPTLLERTTRLPKPMLCQGFPIAPLPRAAIDTARRLRNPDVAHTLLAEVVQRGQVSPTRLREELDSGSSRGAALPRRVLTEISTRIRSLAEVWARNLVRQAALPQPEWNCPIRAPNGDLLAIIDAWWDDIGLAWDLNSYQFHPTPEAHAATLRRTTKLTAAGIIVVHTNPAHLRTNPTDTIAELHLAHHHAAQRPRPPVTSQIAGAS